MADFIELLKFLGITPAQIIPSGIVIGLFSLLAWRKVVQPAKAQVDGIRDALTDLHNAAKEIQMHIEQHDKQFSPQHSLDQKLIFANYGKHNSPMRPNENGKRLLKESGFTNLYPEIKTTIFSRMDKMKDYAVNHPETSLELIFGIASWLIRDDYSEYLTEAK